jgi:hypothetical protein
MGDNMAAGPEICIEGEFRIDAGGNWFHEGAPIGRREMVKLFARALIRDADGAYWLKTSVEKVPVMVEDAPFLAVELKVQGRAAAQALRFRTNIDSWVDLGPDHPLIVRVASAGPRPYVALAGGLEALVTRPVYYQLAALAVAGPEGTERPGVWSGGAFFPLTPGGLECSP